MTDWSSEEGSRKLARKIREYWEAREYTPPVITIESLHHHGERATYGIRSDMVNGLPIN